MNPSGVHSESLTKEFGVLHRRWQRNLVFFIDQGRVTSMVPWKSSDANFLTFRVWKESSIIQKDPISTSQMFPFTKTCTKTWWLTLPCLISWDALREGIQRPENRQKTRSPRKHAKLYYANVSRIYYYANLTSSPGRLQKRQPKNTGSQHSWLTKSLVAVDLEDKKGINVMIPGHTGPSLQRARSQ